MSKDEPTYNFTREEWETCLAVLDELKNDPLNNPDNDRFKALINKIKKNSRKQIRKESFNNKRETDLELEKNTTIVKNAISGKSVYSTDSESIQKITYTKLQRPKNCYCCNKSYLMAHSFYNRICPECAEFNYEKRFQKSDLTEQHAVITGCRIKVGYATTLKLLRAGATVIGTTRFPALALECFGQESDFEKWEDQLTIYGLDLRNLKEIDHFIEYVNHRFERLEILVNNAAQTIRYPDDYYLPIINREKELLLSAPENTVVPNATPVLNNQSLIASNAVPDLADLKLTRFGQPVDNRSKTSWNSTLAEVDLMELLEVNLINQIAPYHLVKGFKTLIKKSDKDAKHIINVTSSEGIFSHKNKSHFHPHTNMTKASLNMMTRTAAQDYAKDNIYMNSVDVGWISTGATEALRKRQFEKGYVPPLDSVDGASRILDPIYNGTHGSPIFGKLLKNYVEHDW